LQCKEIARVVGACVETGMTHPEPLEALERLDPESRAKAEEKAPALRRGPAAV
jgi:hypothetical protein